MKEMYCYVGDLLGFQNTILNLDEDKQKHRVEEWILLIEESKEDDHITHSHYVSDTIFIGAEGNKDGLDALLKFSKNLLERGIENSFLLRGAIAFGKIRWDSRITFGPSIVKAYNLANNQNWIGTSCDSGLPDIGSLWDFDKVFVYPVPLKHGLIGLSPVISWSVPLTKDLIRISTDRGLTKPNEFLRWENFGYKIQNTRLYSMYLTKIKDIEMRNTQPKPNPAQFYGTFPTELAEMNIDK